MNERYVLGDMCRHGHDHECSGKTLRYAATGICVECRKIQNKKFKEQFARKLEVKNAKVSKAKPKQNRLQTITACAACNSSQMRYIVSKNKYRCLKCGIVGNGIKRSKCR